MSESSFRQAAVGGLALPDTAPGPGMSAVRERHAAEWGLASLILGSVLAVLALMTVIFAVLYKSNLDRIRPGHGDVLMTIFFCGILTALFALLGVANLFFAMTGLRSALARRQPVGLPLAALLLGGVVAVLWVAVFVGMVMEAADLLRRF